jgi:hypothetical protein
MESQKFSQTQYKIVFLIFNKVGTGTVKISYGSATLDSSRASDRNPDPVVQICHKMIRNKKKEEMLAGGIM